MQPFQAGPAKSHYTTPIQSTLTGIADEVCGTLARLLAYVMTLALFAIAGFYVWDLMPDATTMEPAAKGWTLASRSSPAFSISQIDSRNKTESYEMLRHPNGDRKDVFHWTDQASRPVAELEIYRPGSEGGEPGPTAAGIAARMGLDDMRELETAGIVNSKFGTVTLLRPTSANAGPACLGFLGRADDPSFRLSGWTCDGTTLPARRAAIGCLLDRLILLTAGNDPKLTALFARAELKRADCSPTPALSADWVTGAESPRLRGSL
jgi:hypothetical protein